MRKSVNIPMRAMPMWEKLKAVMAGDSPTDSAVIEMALMMAISIIDNETHVLLEPSSYRVGHPSKSKIHHGGRIERPDMIIVNSGRILGPGKPYDEKSPTEKSPTRIPIKAEPDEPKKSKEKEKE